MDLDLYRDREQTAAKHEFLDRYLERVAYRIASHFEDFVYVDGFSGPWNSKGENLEDTSFMIAIRKLQMVRTSLSSLGKRPRIRCMFVEADPKSFKILHAAIGHIDGIETKALFGRFQEQISEVREFLGNSFSLIFLDPTGWDLPMLQIAPLLRQARGEVIVNFMYEQINRHLTDVRPEIEQSFDRFFGTNAWRLRRDSADREEIVEYYGDQLAKHGDYRHVARTPILKPKANRPHFFLLHCTRRIEGLIHFRNAEHELLPLQHTLRAAAKQRGRVEKSGQPELFGPTETAPQSPLQNERDRQLGSARARFDQETGPGLRLTYEQLLSLLLPLPFITENDVKAFVADARLQGRIVIEGLRDRQRVPRLNSMIVGK